MTDCERMRPLLARAADGSLDADSRASLDAHVASCADCRAALAGQTAVARLLASMTLDEAPAGFAARVRARIEPRPSVVELFDWRIWTLRLAPVAALLGLLAWLPGSGQDTWTLAAAEVAWASGSANGSSAQAGAVPGAMLFDPDTDPYDLLAAALEVQPQ